eukprot:Nk52_evm23s2462 gene=Nk52_evmTU23s2462
MAGLLVSGYERAFIIDGISQHNLREDGRTNLDMRALSVQTGILSNTYGSARLQLGPTELLVGVKADLAPPLTDRPASGRIEFSVDWATSQQQQMGGAAKEKVACDLEEMLYRMMNNTDHLFVTREEEEENNVLCIVPGKYVWLLHVDVLILTHRLCGNTDSGNYGNLFDAASLTVRAALANTKIPKVRVISGGSDGDAANGAGGAVLGNGCGDDGMVTGMDVDNEDGEEDIEVSGDPEDMIALDATRVPILITLTRIVDTESSKGTPSSGASSSVHIVDATWREGACSNGRVMVCVNGQGRLCGQLMMNGVNSGRSSSGLLHHSELVDMIQSGKRIGQKLIKQMDTHLRGSPQKGTGSIKNNTRTSTPVTTDKKSFTITN